MRRLSVVEKDVICAAVPGRGCRRGRSLVSWGGRRRTVQEYVERLRRRPPRCGAGRCVQLSLAEREEISRGLAEGVSLRSIAARAGPVAVDGVPGGGSQRWPASVSGGAGEDRAWVRARRPKPAKLAVHASCAAVVEEKLEQRWSPQQIAGWLREEFPGRPEMQVSHETIYLSLFVQSRGSAAQGAARLPASRARHPPPARLLHLQRSGPAARRGAHQRAARRGRGPGGARALGR